MRPPVRVAGVATLDDAIEITWSLAGAIGCAGVAAGARRTRLTAVSVDKLWTTASQEQEFPRNSLITR